MIASQSSSSGFSVFNGAIVVKAVQPPHKAFAFEVEFHKAQWPASLKGNKPPMHFHPHQEEYIEILHGKLCVDIEDEEHMLEDGSGELSVKPWTNHRLYPPEDFGGESIIRFFLSAESTSELFQLDTLFFENWYRYQEEVVSAGKSLDMLQVISMFDAGGSYLTLPRMVPFRGYVSQALSIVVGRWIGSIFGYQPFYKLWSGDWDVARKKMASSYFQRKFAVKSISCE